MTVTGAPPLERRFEELVRANERRIYAIARSFGRPRAPGPLPGNPDAALEGAGQFSGSLGPFDVGLSCRSEHGHHPRQEERPAIAALGRLIRGVTPRSGMAVVGAFLVFALPRVGDSGERAYDTLTGMAILTAYLAFMWWRVRSRPREIRSELDSYLGDLSSGE